MLHLPRINELDFFFLSKYCIFATFSIFNFQKKCWMLYISVRFHTFVIFRLSVKRNKSVETTTAMSNERLNVCLHKGFVILLIFVFFSAAIHLWLIVYFTEWMLQHKQTNNKMEIFNDSTSIYAPPSIIKAICWRL